MHTQPFGLTTILAGTACSLTLGASARAQCGEWSSGFHLPGVDGSVYAVAQFDDGSGPALYVAGTFGFAGDVAVEGLARWDGTNWTPLGAGLDSGDFVWVRALQVWDDGNGPALYAGGYFTSAGGSPVNSVARWDGTQWSPLGAGVLGGGTPITCMTVFDDGSGPALYAGGLFTLAGGQSASHVARWNGSAWSSLGAGITSANPFDTVIENFEVFDDGSGPALYVSGRFDLAGGTSVSNIARWNGSAWSGVGGGLPGESFGLEAFDDGSGAALYVTGTFTVAGSEGIARWNGSSWSGVGSGIVGSLGCDAPALRAFDDGSGPALYAGGWFHPLSCGSQFESVTRWNGSTWSNVGLGIGHGGVLTLEPFDDGSGPVLVAGGNFTSADGIGNRAVATWGGSSWSSLGEGRGVLKYVRAITSTLASLEGGPAMYAGGFFTGIPGSIANGVARWDGTQWWPLGTGLNNGVSALKLYDDGSGPALFAGGYFTTAGGLTAKHIAKWNGTTWSNVGAGLNAAVHALTVFDDGSGPALYAAGHFAGNVARWDGSSWNVVGGGMNGDVYDVIAHDDGSGPALYAAGDFNVAGGQSALRIARWDGTTWSALGAGFGTGQYALARALAVFDDGSGPALYVAGKSTYRVERWDGSTWSAVGGGLDNEAHAMSVVDDGSGPALYVGGDFLTAGGVAAERVAKWNGVAWSSLGAGVDARVTALGSFPRGSFSVCDVFLGGEFEHAGEIPSAYIARWTNPCACSPTTYCTSGTSSFGCNAIISGTGTPSASGSSTFTLVLTGVDGQRISYFYYGVNGPMSAPWGPSTSVLCVAAPRQRMGNQFTGGTPGQCDGSLTRDWNAFLASHPNAIGTPFSIGQEVRAQAWYRDPPSAKSTGLSNGLRFTICP